MIIRDGLSENTRLSIQAKQAAREYKRRKEAVEILVRAHGGDVDAAISHYQSTCLKAMKEIPDDLVVDLLDIREELKGA